MSQNKRMDPLSLKIIERNVLENQKLLLEFEKEYIKMAEYIEESEMYDKVHCMIIDGKRVEEPKNTLKEEILKILSRKSTFVNSIIGKRSSTGKYNEDSFDFDDSFESHMSESERALGKFYKYKKGDPIPEYIPRPSPGQMVEEGKQEEECLESEVTQNQKKEINEDSCEKKKSDEIGVESDNVTLSWLGNSLTLEEVKEFYWKYYDEEMKKIENLMKNL